MMPVEFMSLDKVVKLQNGTVRIEGCGFKLWVYIGECGTHVADACGVGVDVSWRSRGG
jgi:hypothetical protein